MNDWYKILALVAFSLMLGVFIHESRLLKHGINKWLWKNPYKRKILIFAALSTFFVGLVVLIPKV